MSLILNIDTCSKSTSVALAENGEILELKEAHEVVSHASKLTPFIENVLKNANKKFKELDAIAIGIGPGSYTGLRIGMSTAKGLSYALGIPLISVCPLEAMARKLNKQYKKNNKLFVSVMNSRKNEIYCTLLEHDKGIIAGPKPVVLDNTFLQDYKNENVIIGGTGLEKVKNVLLASNVEYIENMYFTAENMVSIAQKKYLEEQFEDLAYVEPNYLKPFMTT